MRFILFLLLTVSLTAYEYESAHYYEIGVMGPSRHHDQSQDLNEENWGGFMSFVHQRRKGDRWETVVTLGCYKDSFYETSFFATIGPRYTFGNPRKFNTKIGVNVGHSTAYDIHLFASPTVSIGYDRISIGTMLLSNPLNKHDNPVLGTFLTASLAEF